MKLRLLLLCICASVLFFTFTKANAQYSSTTPFYGTVFDTLTTFVSADDSVACVSIGGQVSEWFEQQDTVLRFKVPYKAPSSGNIVLSYWRRVTNPVGRASGYDDIGDFTLEPLRSFTLYGLLSGYSVVAKQVLSNTPINIESAILTDSLSTVVQAPSRTPFQPSSYSVQRTFQKLKEYTLKSVTYDTVSFSSDTLHLSQSSVLHGTNLSLTNKVVVLDTNAPASTKLLIYGSDKVTLDSLQFVFDDTKVNPNWISVVSKKVELRHSTKLQGNILAEDTVELLSNLGRVALFTDVLRVNNVNNGLTGLLSISDKSVTNIPPPSYPTAGTYTRKYGNLLIGGDFPLNVFSADPTQNVQDRTDMRIDSFYSPNDYFSLYDDTYPVFHHSDFLTQKWNSMWTLDSLTNFAWGNVKTDDEVITYTHVRNQLGSTLVNPDYFIDSLYTYFVKLPNHFSAQVDPQYPNEPKKIHAGKYKRRFINSLNSDKAENLFLRDFDNTERTGLMRAVLGAPLINRHKGYKTRGYRGNFYQKIMEPATNGRNTFKSSGLKRGRYVVWYSAKKELYEPENLDSSCILDTFLNKRYKSFLDFNSFMDFGSLRRIQPVVLGSGSETGLNFSYEPAYTNTGSYSIASFLNPNRKKYELNQGLKLASKYVKFPKVDKGKVNGYFISDSLLKNKPRSFYRTFSGDSFLSAWQRFSKVIEVDKDLPFAAIGFGVWEEFNSNLPDTSAIYRHYLNPKIPSGGIMPFESPGKGICGSSRHSYDQLTDRFKNIHNSVFYHTGFEIPKIQNGASGTGGFQAQLYTMVFGSYLFDNLMMLRIPEIQPVNDTSKVLMTHLPDSTPVANICLGGNLSLQIKPGSYTPGLEVVFPNYSKADYDTGVANNLPEVPLTAYLHDTIKLEKLPVKDSIRRHFGSVHRTLDTGANKFKVLVDNLALDKRLSLSLTSFTNSRVDSLHGKLLNPNILLQLLDRGHATFSALNIPGEPIKRVDFFDNSFKIRLFAAPVVRTTDFVVTSSAKNLTADNHPRFNSPISVAAGQVFKIKVYSITNPSDTDFTPYVDGLKHRYRVVAVNYGGQRTSTTSNDYGFEGEFQWTIPSNSGNYSLNITLENIAYVNGRERIVPGCKVTHSIPVRVFCTPLIPDLVLNTSSGAGPIELITEIQAAELFEVQPPLSPVGPKKVLNKVFYITKNTNIVSGGDGVEFENCTFYFEGYGGRAWGNPAYALFQANNPSNNDPIPTNPCGDGSCPFSNFPCGIINGPFLNLNPGEGILKFTECKFESPCNYPMWGGIKILTTPKFGDGSIQMDPGEGGAPTPQTVFGLQFLNSDFKDMYHGLTDTLDPTNVTNTGIGMVKSSIMIDGCRFRNNRIGIHIKGMPFTTNTHGWQSGIAHLKTVIQNSRFSSRPVEMHFPLEKQSYTSTSIQGLTTNYEHHGFMGVYVDNKRAINQHQQYAFENCRFDSLLFGIRARDTGGTTVKSNSLSSNSLGSNLLVVSSSFRNCMVAGVSNYFRVCSMYENEDNLKLYAARTTVLNSSFILKNKPNLGTVTFCGLNIDNLQLLKLSGIFGSGFIKVDNGEGIDGFSSENSRTQHFHGITVPNGFLYDSSCSSGTNENPIFYQDLVVKGASFTGFDKAIVHHDYGLVDIQNNTFLDNAVAVDLYDGVKDFYLGCNSFRVTCIEHPDYTGVYDHNEPVNLQCYVPDTTIGVRFNGGLIVKSNKKSNYVSGKLDPSILQNAPLNELPRGGNTWPIMDFRRYRDTTQTDAFQMPSIEMLDRGLTAEFVEAPYIQYVENSDPDFASDPSYQQVMRPVWKFNNPNWFSFFDNRVNIEKIVYLPYTNEFVDEKLCSEYDMTISTFLCDNVANLFLRYPDRDGRIMKTFNQTTEIDPWNGPVDTLYIVDLCERMASKLQGLYGIDFSTSIDSCILALSPSGPGFFGFYDPINKKNLRVLEIRCSNNEYEVNQIPVPIFFRSKPKDGAVRLSYVKVYPNPLSSELKVELSDLEHGVDYMAEIADLKGVVLSKYRLSDKLSVLDLSALSSGVYTLQLSSSDGLLFKKIKLTLVR